jgi:hypothetical protein
LGGHGIDKGEADSHVGQHPDEQDTASSCVESPAPFDGMLAREPSGLLTSQAPVHPDGSSRFRRIARMIKWIGDDAEWS